MNKKFASFALCFTLLALMLAAFSGFAYAECIEQGIEAPSEDTLAAPEVDPDEEVVEQNTSAKDVSFSVSPKVEYAPSDLDDDTQYTFYIKLSSGDNDVKPSAKIGNDTITFEKVTADDDKYAGYYKFTLTKGQTANFTSTIGIKSTLSATIAEAPSEDYWISYTVTDKENESTTTKNNNTISQLDVEKNPSITFTNTYNTTRTIKITKELDEDNAFTADYDHPFTVIVRVFNTITDTAMDLTENFPAVDSEGNSISFEPYTSSNLVGTGYYKFTLKAVDSATFTLPCAAKIYVEEVKDDDFTIVTKKEGLYGYKLNYTWFDPGAGNDYVTFKGIRRVAFVHVSEQVYGTERDDTFTFNITVQKSGKDIEYKYRKNWESPSSYVTETGALNGVKMKKDYELVLMVPQGTVVTAEEITDSRYTTTAIINSNFRFENDELAKIEAVTTKTGTKITTDAIEIPKDVEDMYTFRFVVFTNTKKPTPQPVETYDVTVTKRVSGDGDKSRYFSFEYTITNPDDSISSGKFELRDGESKKIISLRENASIVVREIPVTDYTTTYTVSGDATEYPTTDGATESMAITDGMELIFTGTYTPAETPTAEPTQEPTEQPTAEPTATHTAEPTVTPTATPTVTPTSAPTTAPAQGDTPKPTAAPTAAPTTGPTAEPTAGDTAIATVTTSGSMLRLRAAASTSSKVITKIPNGTDIVVLKFGSDWSLCRYNGYTGYCSNDYLTFG